MKEKKKKINRKQQTSLMHADSYLIVEDRTDNRIMRMSRTELVHQFWERLGGPEKDRCDGEEEKNFLSSLASDSSGQLDVLGHDGDTLGMDGAQVGIFKETDQVGFTGFLKGHDGRALESEISFEVLGNFSHQTLEGQFADQEFSALLVTSDFSQSDGSWPVSVGFLDTTGSRGGFSGSLGCQLFTWGLASSRFTGGLLSTSHFFWSVNNTVSNDTEY